MLRDPLIKGKLPYSSSFKNLNDAYDYLVKKLNSSFSKRIEEIQSSGVNISDLNGVGAIISFSDSTVAQVYYKDITIVHNLGSIPSGYLIKSKTVTYSLTVSNWKWNDFILLSKNSSTITFRFLCDGTSGSFGVTAFFDILILK